MTDQNSQPTDSAPIDFSSIGGQQVKPIDFSSIGGRQVSPPPPPSGTAIPAAPDGTPAVPVNRDIPPAPDGTRAVPIDFSSLGGVKVYSSVEPLKAQPSQPSTLDSPDQASQHRMSAVAGLTGMPTPNMNENDRQEFETGKAAGAASAAATMAVGAGGAAASAAMPFLKGGAKAINSWAKENPTQALMVYETLKALIPDAAKAVGIGKKLAGE